MLSSCPRLPLNVVVLTLVLCSYIPSMIISSAMIGKVSGIFDHDVQETGPTSFPKRSQYTTSNRSCGTRPTLLAMCAQKTGWWWLMVKRGCEIDSIVELIVRVDVPISQPFFPAHISLLVPQGWIRYTCISRLFLHCNPSFGWSIIIVEPPHIGGWRTFGQFSENSRGQL